MATENERTAITSHLEDYGTECEFEPLIARDYGSRSRGLASSSSDYDVFFVFVQEPSEYALGTDTEAYTKSIKWTNSELDTEIELHGWSLRKMVGGDGLAGSNPSAVECALSNEQYFIRGDCRSAFETMFDETVENFKPYALINHYRSMAAGNYGKYIEQSWVREWSADQFTEYTGKPAGQTRVDGDELTIGILGYDEHTISIPLEEAEREGMIRRTTRDSTVKRYVNVIESLIRARMIEETHTAPTPMLFGDLVSMNEHREWLPFGLVDEINMLIGSKRSGNGGREVDLPTANEWIKSELDREIEPREHVQRQPDRDLIYDKARTIYNTVYDIDD